MIGSLRGFVLNVDSTTAQALIEVGGVGYRVQFTATGLVSLPDIGEESFVYIHHHIREADEQLFGFLSLDERFAFEALLSAHGVGPRACSCDHRGSSPDRPQACRSERRCRVAVPRAWRR